MDLELHQLDRRYEELRKRDPRRERQLLASLAEVGQQLPIVVVASGKRFIVIDGYKRVRALAKLARDCVRATSWEVEEVEALMLERLMRRASEDALEQAWLLSELHQRFGLSGEELAQRFDRSKSWVSRRLALVDELPAAIQTQVRSGEIAAHAAMKYLVPLARANFEVAVKLAEAIAPLKPTTRQVEQLYSGWQSGTERTRDLILATPQIYLRARQQHDIEAEQAKSPAQRLLNDLGAMSGIARRAGKSLNRRLLERLIDSEREEISRVAAQARLDAEHLFSQIKLEDSHAR